MRKFLKIILLSFFAIFLCSQYSTAALTPVLPTTNFGEISLIPFIESIYGVEGTGLLRIDDAVDQIWTNIDGSATAIARYAGDTQEFGYMTGPGFVTFNSLFLSASSAESLSKSRARLASPCS